MLATYLEFSLLFRKKNLEKLRPLTAALLESLARGSLGNTRLRRLTTHSQSTHPSIEDKRTSSQNWPVQHCLLCAFSILDCIFSLVESLIGGGMELARLSLRVECQKWSISIHGHTTCHSPTSY